MKRKDDAGPKRTLIDADESPEQRDREGFVSACQYGSMRPELNEIGGIFVRVRNTRLEHGMWVHDAECVERVFVTPNVELSGPKQRG